MKWAPYYAATTHPKPVPSLLIILETDRRLVARGQWLYLKASLQEGLFFLVTMVREQGDKKAFLFYKDKQGALQRSKPSTQLAGAAINAQNVCHRQSKN